MAAATALAAAAAGTLAHPAVAPPPPLSWASTASASACAATTSTTAAGALSRPPAPLISPAPAPYSRQLQQRSSVAAGARRPPNRGWVNTDEAAETGTRPAWRRLRPLEERVNIRVEKNVGEARAEELGVWRWSAWESGPCAYSWHWRADQEVYIVKGAIKVVVEEAEGCAWFYAGDLVRFPKWLRGQVSVQGQYEERYRFRAYGDD